MPLPKLPLICISAVTLIGCSKIDSQSNPQQAETPHKSCPQHNPFCDGNCSHTNPEPATTQPLSQRSSEPRFDEEMNDKLTKSSDLNSDIKLMWKTVPHKEFPVSPVSAINAASRVFETVQLKGKTKEEIFALIGNNETSNNSGYNFPFFPCKKGDLVYRFDCGNFGWQFNIEFDNTGRASEVKRLGID